MNFDNLLTELDFAELMAKVKSRTPFDFCRTDKTNKIEISMGLKFCDNGVWADNLMCFVHGMKNRGDYHGFARPHQHAEFSKLTYQDIAKYFECFGYKVADIQQMNLFNLMGKGA